MDDTKITISKRLFSSVFNSSAWSYGDFPNAGITDDDVPDLARIIIQFYKGNFTRVNLRHNHLTDEGILQFLSLIGQYELRIDASCNPISDVGCLALVKHNLPHYDRIHDGIQCSFESTHITDSGLLEVVKIIDQYQIKSTIKFVFVPNTPNITYRGIANALYSHYNRVKIYKAYVGDPAFHHETCLHTNIRKYAIVHRRIRVRILAYEMFPQLYLKKFL